AVSGRAQLRGHRRLRLSHARPEDAPRSAAPRAAQPRSRAAPRHVRERARPRRPGREARGAAVGRALRGRAQLRVPRARRRPLPAAAGRGRSAQRRGRRGPYRARSGRRDRHLGHVPDRVREPPARGAGAVVIARLIATCAQHRGLSILVVLAAAAWGVASLRQTPLDAIPDLSDVQVIVFTEWPGQSPNLVEDQITYPISARLLSAPHVRSVRGQSFFGLSFVYAIFEDGTDLYWARSRVLEYLAGVSGQLPAGVVPVIGPDATGVGWVFEYALVDRTGRHDLAELRSLQDWNLRYALASVPGVAEVASVGGFVRQYQVQVDPNKLLARGLPIQEVIRAVRESNEDAGGQVVEFAGHEYALRGRGRIGALEDLRRVPLRASDAGTPVYLEDVATVSFGPDARRGLVELDGEGEAVGGIVVMRFGENALRVIDRVKARLDELRPGLPEGVEVVVTYDRSELIEGAIATLRRTLLEEMAIVSFVIFAFLLHARSALVPILTIPIGVVLAFVPMVRQGLTANIMSLG